MQLRTTSWRERKKERKREGMGQLKAHLRCQDYASQAVVHMQIM